VLTKLIKITIYLVIMITIINYY